MIEIKDVSVAIACETIHKKRYDEQSYEKYWLKLSMPVPGGELKYSLEINKEQYDHFVFANNLVQAGLKK